jgi:hypothetical protein
MILINQNGVFRICFGDPGASIFYAAGILRDGKYLKTFIF